MPYFYEKKWQLEKIILILKILKNWFWLKRKERKISGNERAKSY